MLAEYTRNREHFFRAQPMLSIFGIEHQIANDAPRDSFAELSHAMMRRPTPSSNASPTCNSHSLLKLQLLTDSRECHSSDARRKPHVKRLEFIPMAVPQPLRAAARALPVPFKDPSGQAIEMAHNGVAVSGATISPYASKRPSTPCDRSPNRFQSRSIWMVGNPELC